MGIRHKLNTFSDKQVIAGTAVSTNVIDTGASKIGDGNPVDLEVIVTTNFATGTSLTVQICDCATAGGSYVMRQESAVIAVADLTTAKNPVYKSALPNNLARYLQLNYVVAGSNFDTGSALSAYLVDRSK